MKKGIVYGTGIGPGDPELLTIKAVRLIRESPVIAVPGQNARESLAFRIAAAAVPEIAEKELAAVHLPMIRDPAQLQAAYKTGASQIEKYLDQGKNVVFLTLGDVTVYSTFSRLHQILEEDGYRTELVSGVPSFCAAAARLNIPLSERDEQLHILPALYLKNGDDLPPGTLVLMKSAGRMKDVKQMLIKSGKDVQAIENCGMKNEKIYRSAEDIPDDAGYFSLVIVRDPALS